MDEDTTVVEEVTEYEDYQNTVNPLVYVATTFVVTAVAYVGYRFWQNRRRNNHLTVVESLPAQNESE